MGKLPKRLFLGFRQRRGGQETLAGRRRRMVVLGHLGSLPVLFLQFEGRLEEIHGETGDLIQACEDLGSGSSQSAQCAYGDRAMNEPTGAGSFSPS